MNVRAKRKILLISPLAPPKGGMATWTELYQKAISKYSNIELVILNTAFIGENVKSMKMSSIKDELKRNFTLVLEAYRMSRKEIDIVHFNSSGDCWGVMRDLLMIKLMDKKTKKICHFHCDLTKMLTSKLSKECVKAIAKYVDKVIVIEENSYNFIRNYTETVEIIPNFFDYDYVSKFAKVSINQTIENISYAGHVKYNKGIDELLEISRYHPNIKFHLYGLVDEKYRDISLSNVYFYGEVERKKMLDDIRKTDLFIFPSHFEGFSLVLLEVMALKMPVIATRVGAAELLLTSKQSQFIFDVGDVEHMSNALYKMNSYNLREELGSYNQRNSMNYADNKQIPVILRLYEEVINYDKI